MERRKLAESEVLQALATLPAWEKDGDQIRTVRSFDSYLAGVDFVTKIAALAEALDHHPDLLLGYRKVTVTLSTHDLGGLSTYDFALAGQIESL